MVDWLSVLGCVAVCGVLVFSASVLAFQVFVRSDCIALLSAAAMPTVDELLDCEMMESTAASSTVRPQSSVPNAGTMRSVYVPPAPSSSEATPRKFRRLGSASLASGTPTKKEEPEEGEDGPIVEVGELEESSSEALAQKLCVGWLRKALTGLCYHQPGMTVEWSLANWRSKWCRDCFNVWRLIFRDRIAQACMEQYLKNNMPIQIEWDVARVSYISIKKGRTGSCERPPAAGPHCPL